MNNSVNYGSFIDLIIASQDNDEAYGINAQPASLQLSASASDYEPMQAELFDRAMHPTRSD